jgi:hypothetical protein
MQGETKQRWEELCEQAATEQDPDKFFQLIREINRLLEERRSNLSEKKPREPSGGDWHARRAG